MTRRSTGFTLVELMIVVAILGVIATIAYPQYQSYVLKGKRAECRTALLEAVQKQERYLTANNTYTATLSAAGIPAFSGGSATAGACSVSVVPGAAGIATSFTAKATPSNYSDPACNILTLTHTGAKGMEGATETNVSKCW